MDNIKRLIEEIDEIKEVLECGDKVLLIERLMLQDELNEKEKLLNQLYAKSGQPHISLKEKGFEKRKNLIKDKRKHGRYWESGRRQYALYCAETSVRSYKKFIPKGAGYRKIFDVPWTIW